jgi:hypothetical protein
VHVASPRKLITNVSLAEQLTSSLGIFIIVVIRKVDGQSSNGKLND